MKKLSLVFALFMLITLASAANYDFFYNPYTAQPDRSLKLNQSGSEQFMANLTLDGAFIKTSGSLNLTLFPGGGGNVTVLENLYVVKNISGYINASNVKNDDWVENGQISSLNVNNSNSSNFWDALDVPADLNNKVLSDFTNITNRPTSLSNFTPTITANLNMTNQNITNVTCIIFSSGGSICSAV